MCPKQVLWSWAHEKQLDTSPRWKVFHKSVTHPTKVSRHREAPMRALKIKISFMFAGSSAQPGKGEFIRGFIFQIKPIWQNLSLHVIEFSHLSEPSRQPARGRPISPSKKYFPLTHSNRGGGEESVPKLWPQECGVLSHVLQGRGKQGQTEFIPALTAGKELCQPTLGPGDFSHGFRVVHSLFQRCLDI